jgi:Holliday junction resolvase RusA-like endonuclease
VGEVVVTKFPGDAFDLLVSGLSVGPSMSFEVVGDPAPQGSKSYKGRTKAGKPILAESSAKVKPWRQDVVAAALAAIGAHEWVKLDGPVLLDITFFLPRPVSAPKRVRLPFRRPDLSKLVRSTEDALTTAGVYADDARITDLHVRKRFAVAWTGALITVSPALFEHWLAR